MRFDRTVSSKFVNWTLDDFYGIIAVCSTQLLNHLFPLLFFAKRATDKNQSFVIFFIYQSSKLSVIAKNKKMQV